MAIGIAMLGFGASGTLVTLWGRRPKAVLERWFLRAALVTAPLLLAAPLAADMLPFDATQLAVDPAQWAPLALVYLALAVPFGTGALAILLAITLDAPHPGRIYGASFAGAAVGAVVALGTLWLVDPVRAVALPGLLAGFGAVAAARSAGTGRGWLAAATGGVLLAVAGVAVPPWSLDVTPYKGLPQVEAYPESHLVGEATSPVGWVVAVAAPAFRHAPGLSLAYRGTFPHQTGLFVDGQLTGALSVWTDTAQAALLDWLPGAAPYAVGPRERVLVIGAGEGIDVYGALRNGAALVTAVELHPALVALQRASPTPAEWRADRRVRWVVGDARSYLARASESYDLITIGPAGGFGTTAGGLYALSEDYLHTIDAYATYLRRLAPGGMLVVTRWLTVPPRENVRVVLTAAQALRQVEPDAVTRGLVVLRGWGTVTTIVRPDGFSSEELDALDAWLAQRRFDADWRPGLRQPPVARFNRLAASPLYRAAAAAVQGDSAEAALLDRYPFVVAPVSDARPFPHHFLDLGTARRLLAAERGDWLPFAEWGYIALAATLIQAVALAAVLTLLPAAVRTRAAWRPHLIPLLVYFAAIGLAYLAAEIAAIQQLALLLGHPVYAVVAVLAVMLACSGLGSAWSDRTTPRRGAVAAMTLAALLGVAAAALLGLVHMLQGWPLVARAAASLAMLVPIAFLMGIPFPMGLRALARGDQARVAWAWAMNGFASVIAAPLAALIALEAGTPVLFGAAALSYGTAALIQRRYAGGG